MLRCYRGKGIAALVGVVLLLWTFGLGYYVAALNYPDEQRHQSYRYAADQPLDIDPAAASVPGTKPLEYREPCHNPKGRDESDLCAQWNAANAARDNAFWAKWGVWITGIGIIGLLITIVQGRMALERAHDANEIARESSERQLRAYIMIEPQGVNVPEDGLMRVPMDIINNGQTPAYNLEIAGDFLIVDGDPRQFDPAIHGRLGDDTASTDGILGPGSNRFSYAYMEAELCAPFWGGICDKNAAIIHYGYLKYRDVFGKERKTNFAFYHWGEELSDVESKRCRFGNSAT